MKTRKGTSSAVEILHRRLIGDSVERKKSLEEERVNSAAAKLIYDLRTNAGLTQGELANLVQTTQSVISRLEDMDYDGHSLTMLDRITSALQQRLKIVAINPEPAMESIRRAFKVFARNLRKERGLTLEKAAEKIEIEVQDLRRLEEDPDYVPSPLLLHRFGKFYDVPQTKLLALAGATKEIPGELEKEASRFAAQSQSFSKLSKDEKKLLDEFMKFLRK